MAYFSRCSRGFVFVFLTVAVLICGSLSAQAQIPAVSLIPEITTVAGNGTQSYSGDGGPATSAEFYFPEAVAVDSAGNLYIADHLNHRIRKIMGATGTITTVAGNGLQGYGGDNGPATSAQLDSPWGITLDLAGNLYIVDQMNQRIRMVSAATGIITTVAGNGTAGYSGDNISAAGAQLNNPYSVAVDAAGNFYIADSRNNRIRKVTPGGLITTVAGNGNPGYSGDNGPATAAELRWPSGVALDSAGNLYIADYGNSRIRMVTAATGIITTVAGNGTFGYNGDNIAATSAELGGPAGLRLDAAGNLYIADQFNNRIRKVTAASGIITTVAGNGYGGGTGDCGGGYNGDNIAASSAELYCPADVALDGAGNLYIADYGNHRIRMVAAATSIITTVAGNGVYGFSGDGGPATSTQLFYPEGVALDAAGNLYIADSANYRLRMVTAATGIITTVAGNGTQGYSGDNGPANNAELDYPAAVVLDPAGNLYIADINNQRIRAVSVTTLPLGFAPTQINSNSATQTFTLANIGNAPLNLSGITLSPNFTGDASTTTCSTSSALSAGDSCAVGVMFSPTTIGDVAQLGTCFFFKTVSR